MVHLSAHGCMKETSSMTTMCSACRQQLNPLQPGGEKAIPETHLTDVAESI